MKSYFMVLVLFYFLPTRAQSNTKNNLTSWWNISIEVPFSKQTCLNSTYSWRRTEFVKNWQQSLFRVEVSYHLSPKISITPGYDWVVNFLHDSHFSSLHKTEHRLFEQLSGGQELGSLKLKHRFRLEQRLFENEMVIRHRLRHRMQLFIPLFKKLSLEIYDEFFLNYPASLQPQWFDQNWVFGGISHKLSEDLTLNLGYMHQQIQKSDGKTWGFISLIQTGIKYNLHKREAQLLE